MATGNEVRLTTDHEEIRRWVEEVGGRPVQVRITGGNSEVGVVDLAFPGADPAGDVEPLSWEDWFRGFDHAGLALLYDPGEPSPSRTFTKLVQR